MKKILIFLCSLLLCSCSNNDEVKANVDAIDVVNQMFELSQVDRYESEKIYDLDDANHSLNIGTNMNGGAAYQLNNFASGAEAAPMMMLDTDCIIVLELTDTSNIDKVKELIMANKSRGICVVADDEDVAVLTRDNFVCFIASSEHKDDFVEAFNNVNLTEYQYTGDSAFSKMMSDYKNSTNDLVRNIDKINEASYVLNPDSNYAFTASDITQAYIMAAENNYDLEEPMSSYVYFIVQFKNNGAEIKQAMEQIAINGKIIGYNFSTENVTVTSQDNYLILEAK